MFTDFFKSGSALTNDIIVLVTLFVLLLTYMLYFGKSRVISLVLAFYPAVFLYNQFPYAAKLMLLHGAELVVLNKVLIFLLFFVPIDIIINRFIFSESGYGSSSHIFRAIILSLVGVALVLVFDYSVISFDIFYSFSPHISTLFTQTNLFWWTLAPLALMFFL